MTAAMPIPGLIDPVPVPRPAAAGEGARVNLIGLSKAEIRAALAAAGLDERQAKLRAKQLWHQIYNRGATDFDAMSDIAKPQRAWLAERFEIARPEVVTEQVSTDGTRKWLLRTPDGHDFEMVFIPDADRGTLCVSSQVGCTLNCRFCHTGTMRLVRNLDAGEIVGQVMLARDALGEWPSQPEGRMLSNIVMMGMGEPLYNFDNVRDALKIVMDGDGLGLSRRRITLSTSGVVPMMARAGEEIGVNLAVSLHAVTKEVRDEIVPLEPQIRDRGAARGLRRLSRRQQCPADHLRICDAEGQERQRRGCARAGPADPQVQAARQGQPDPVQPLARRGLRMFGRGADPRASPRSSSRPASRAPIRRPRGRDIMAACGQLKSAAEKKSRAELDRIAAEKQAALA